MRYRVLINAFALEAACFAIIGAGVWFVWQWLT